VRWAFYFIFFFFSFYNGPLAGRELCDGDNNNNNLEKKQNKQKNLINLASTSFRGAVLLLIITPIRMLYVMLLYARHLSLFCHFSPFWRPLSRVLYYIPALRPIALLHIVWGPFNFPVI
jgi:hypothetical protein